jgi:hypothetical protein
VSGADIFLTVVYIAYIASPLLPDELWLRLALATTSFGFVIWGAIIENGVVVLANGLFLLLSMWQVTRLIKERRPVELTDEQQLIYDTVFPSMTPQQFKLFWDLGEPFVLHEGEQLITAEADVTHVSVLIDGALGVEGSEKLIRLDPPALVGEMSFVRGKEAMASSNVIGLERSRGHWWAKTTLYSLHDTHPELTGPLLRSIGRDLAAKLRTN